MFMFNSDLLARPENIVDPTGVATHVYRLIPEILARLGVRYIISDGTLNGYLINEVLRETSSTGTVLRLYEIQNANLGNYSPTKVTTTASYDDAISYLRRMQDTVVLLGSTALPADLVPARHARLTVIKGGYHLSAESLGTSILVLPVQFSHCWEIVAQPDKTASTFRANIVQTGVYFESKIDADLRFGFGLPNSSCRKKDGEDVHKYFSRSSSKMYGYSPEVDPRWR
jgi:hypothetical protein